jgi:hypothetical protein
MRVPDGYASNISHCVRLKERMISGLKSHDSYVLMRQLRTDATASPYCIARITAR